VLTKLTDWTYFQGDLEKQMGHTPIPLMDRDKKNEVPKSQVSVNILITIIPIITTVITIPLPSLPSP
jgi:hypothetical protein